MFGTPGLAGGVCRYIEVGNGLNGIVSGEQADIVCNECAKVVRTLPAKDLRRALDHMELTLAVATANCPHCGNAHLTSGFSKLIAFVCDSGICFTREGAIDQVGVREQY